MNALTGLERCFGWLLQTTWQAAVIALIILLAQLLLRERLSPAWRHGLWFLLVARLLMPMAPSSAVSVFNLTKWSRQKVALVSAPAPAPETLDLASSIVIARPDREEVQSAPSPSAPPKRLSAPIAPKPFQTALARPAELRLTWKDRAAFVWLAGVLVLALRFVSLEGQFAARLSDGKPIADEAASKLFDNCALALRVRGKVHLIETAEVDSPAVYGLWRKRLLLPIGLCEELSANELRHVLWHELAHIKRRDPELNWLLVLLQILHWFNPVLWFAFARVRADRELATDELALAQTDPADRVSYGETILKVLEGLSPQRVLPGLVGIGESKAEMKERIRAIARGGSIRRWRWATGAVAVLIAGVTLTNALDENANSPKTGSAPPPPPAGPPKAVSIVPTNGATSVDPGLTEIKVVFDRPMLDQSWSFVSREENDPHTPQINGQIHYDATRTTWTAPVKLKPNWKYEFGLNDPEFRNFKSETGVSLQPIWVTFRTGQSTKISEPGPEPSPPSSSDLDVDTNLARVVAVFPADGAENVDPVQSLRIRFDRPMDPHHLKLEWRAGGFQLNGGIEVGADQREFVLPVRLTSGRLQNVTLNHDPFREAHARNGQKGTKRGRPAGGGFLDTTLAPANEFRWSFETKEAPSNSAAPKPRVVSVSPASGATTPVLTMVEITFDQPMRAPEEELPFLRKKAPFAPQGASLIPSIDYNSALRRFTVPAMLPPDDDSRLTLLGFTSAEGVASDPLVLHYQTGNDNLDPAYAQRAKAAARDPALRTLLARMASSSPERTMRMPPRCCCPAMKE
jgi:beta-lactamase regulating signal transducer with metallopeptidase domain